MNLLLVDIPYITNVFFLWINLLFMNMNRYIYGFVELDLIQLISICLLLLSKGSTSCDHICIGMVMMFKKIKRRRNGNGE